MEMILRRASWVLLGWLVAVPPTRSALGNPTDGSLIFTNVAFFFPVIFPRLRTSVAFALEAVGIRPFSGGLNRKRKARI